MAVGKPKVSNSQTRVLIVSDGDITLSEAQLFVAASSEKKGFVEVVRCGQEQVLLVNEDGQSLRLPINMWATEFYHGFFHSRLGKITSIFGDVVVLLDSTLSGEDLSNPAG